MIIPKVFAWCGQVNVWFSTKLDLPDYLVWKGHWDEEDKVAVRSLVVDTVMWWSCAWVGKNNDLIAFTNQVHGSNFLFADWWWCVGDADALWTDVVWLPLVVQVADCVPVLIYVAWSKPMVCAVHVGWKWLAWCQMPHAWNHGIVHKVMKTLVSHWVSVEDMYVWVGPSICQDHYEFGSECKMYFDDTYILEGQKLHDKCFWVDVKGCVIDQLLAFGIRKNRLEISWLCTYEEDHLLYSFRRERGSGKRMYGVIGLI